MSSFFNIFGKKKVGLVLGSGGSKGIAHIAVIEYLESMGIPIDFCVGSSIGSVVAAIYGLGKLKEFKHDLIHRKKKELFSIVDPVFPRAGLISGQGFMKFLSSYIPNDADIEDLTIPLSITATDYNTGKSIVFRKGNLMEALRASISIPGIFVPVKYRGTWLIDGGVANPLPVNVAVMQEADYIVGVNLHPRIDERKLKKYMKSKKDRWGVVDAEEIEVLEEDSTMHHEVMKHGKVISSLEHWFKNKNKDVPSIFEMISQSIDIMEYVNTMLMLKYNPPTVLIEPDLRKIPTMDFTQVSRILTEGYVACSKQRRALYKKIKRKM
jgi:NTE family protein